MHGSPLLRTLLITALLLLAGAPLWHLTHGTVTAHAATATAESTSKVHLAVTFAQEPLRFQVSYLGKPIWQVDRVTAPAMENQIAMSYPKEGVDLEFKVEWPPGTPLTAARLSVAANENEPVEKTLWGAGKIDDVLTFP